MTTAGAQPRPQVRLVGTQGGPAPTYPIGIWIGAYGPTALALTARLAAGWVPSFRGDMAATARMTRRLEDAAAAAGRDPAELRRILNVSGTSTGGRPEGALDIGQLERFAQEAVPCPATTVRLEIQAITGGMEPG